MIGANGAVGALGFTRLAIASDFKDTGDNMKIDSLLAALRATEKKVCLMEADRLEASTQSTYDFNLHLRRARLETPDVSKIAIAMKGLSGAKDYSMRSFSISYNPGVGDAGAIAFIKSFPKSLTEIGMVDCDLEDESGEILLDWAQQALELRMMCIEGNKFSSGLQKKFSNLREKRRNLFVVL